MAFREFKDGRSDKAAKLHSVTRLARQELAAAKLNNVDETFAGVSGGDYWAERGEADRWVRVHTHRRTFAFLPWKVPGGRGRKTRLAQERSTRGVNSQGQQFRVDDLFDASTRSMLPITPWTGRTIFSVDKAHVDRWGTDQRRQRIEAASLRKPQTMFDEEADSTKSLWTTLSEFANPS